MNIITALCNFKYKVWVVTIQDQGSGTWTTDTIWKRKKLALIRQKFLQDEGWDAGIEEAYIYE